MPIQDRALLLPTTFREISALGVAIAVAIVHWNIALATKVRLLYLAIAAVEVRRATDLANQDLD
jgi:hypothetical protein